MAWLSASMAACGCLAATAACARCCSAATGDDFDVDVDAAWLPAADAGISTVTVDSAVADSGVLDFDPQPIKLQASTSVKSCRIGVRSIEQGECAGNSATGILLLTDGL